MENSMSNGSAGQKMTNVWSLPASYHALFTCLYTITIILSIVGNVLEVTVLVVRKRLSKGVRCSLINLAVSDILMAIFYIPFTRSQMVNGEWFFSLEMCRFTKFMEEIMVLVSVLTLTIIGFDRYLAIVFPFKFQWLRSNSTIIIGLIAIWLVSIGLCAPLPVYATLLQFPPYSYNFCWLVLPSPNGAIIYAWSRLLLTFAIPLTILIITYVSIAYVLLTNIAPGNADTDRDSRRYRKKIKATKLLAVIVLLFGVCWAPLQIYNLISWVDVTLLMSLDHLTNKIMFIFFHWLAMSNCFVNPIIYSFSNNNILNDLRFIYGKIRGKIPENEKLSSKLSNESTDTVVSQISLHKIN